MPSDFDLLATELAAFIDAKEARQMVKAMPPTAPRPRHPPTLVRPVSPAARVRQSKPVSPAQRVEARRREMLAAADQTEILAKSLANAGRITGPESRLIGMQIAQLRRDAGVVR